jgi:hypothetical protein
LTVFATKSPAAAGDRERAHPLLRAASWAHLLGAAGYLGLLATELSTIAAQVRWNADAAGPVLIGNALAAGNLGRPIEMDQPAYLWAFAATAPLGHQQVAMALLPLALSWIGVAAIAIAVARVAGRWAGSMTLGLGIAASPLALLTELAPAFHGVTWCFTGLLGLFVVHLAAQRPRGRWLALCVVLGFVTGAAAATDHLLLVTGLAPLMAVGLWLRFGPPRLRGPLHSVATVGVSAASSFGVAHLLMHEAGYSSGLGGGAARGLAPSIASNAGIVGRGLLDLVDGLPTSGSASAATVAPAIALLFLLLAGVLVVAARTLRAAPDASGDEPMGAQLGSAAASAHVVYWLSSAVLLLLAMLVSNVVLADRGVPPAARLISSERFITGVFLSAIALVPLWPRRLRFRALAALLATLFIAASALRVAAATTDANFQPTPSRALPALQDSLLAHDLTRGYASYWTALPLRLSTNGALDVLPVAEGTQCGGNDVAAMCRSLLSTQAGWFTPRPGRTFVVVDPSDPYVPSPPPASLGAPTQIFTVDRFTVYVYADDVMQSFTSTCAGRSDHRCNP